MNHLNYQIPAALEPYVGQIHKFLEPFLTTRRIERIQSVASNRVRKIITVFEATHHCHNISAILRTQDAIGFQDALFVYEQETKVRMNDSVERGAAEWLTLRRMSSIEQCAQTLNNSGYKIILVSLPTFEISSTNYSTNLPSFNAHNIMKNDFFDWCNNNNIALVFGNEAQGLSPLWHQYASAYMHIPMVGFVESMNLSVCAGILLNNLRAGIEDINPVSYRLNPTERLLLTDLWCMKSCTAALRIIQNSNLKLLDYFTFLQNGEYFKPDIPCG